MDRYAALRKRAVRILAEDPGLFARLLAAHVGETSTSFLAATSMRLGWQFLTAYMERAERMHWFRTRLAKVFCFLVAASLVLVVLSLLPQHAAPQAASCGLVLRIEAPH